jgi:hypothetical protein
MSVGLCDAARATTERPAAGRSVVDRLVRRVLVSARSGARPRSPDNAPNAEPRISVRSVGARKRVVAGLIRHDSTGERWASPTAGGTLASESANGWGQEVRIVRSGWPLLFGALVALVAAGVIGYAIGHHRSSAGFRIRTGMASIVEGGEGTVSFGRDDADPLNPGIPWFDGDGYGDGSPPVWGWPRSGRRLGQLLVA